MSDTLPPLPTNAPIFPPAQPQQPIVFPQQTAVEQPVQQEPQVQAPVMPVSVQQEVTTTPAAPAMPTQPVMQQSTPVVMATPASANPAALPVDTSRVYAWKETQSILTKLEQSLGMRICTLYIPMNSALTNSDVPNVYYHLEKIGNVDKIAFIIYGPGGDGKAAYKLTKLIRKYAKQVTFIVPDLAASAMTMLSLGADQLLVGPLTTFSAIDTSLANHPLAPKDANGFPVSVEITQVRKFLEMVNVDQFSQDDYAKSAYKVLTDNVHPLLLGSVQRSLSLSKKLTQSILKTHMSDEALIEKIATTLNDEYPTHSYPVLPEDLAAFGINVTQLTKEQNLMCIDLIDYFKTLGDGGQRVENNKKSTWSRQAIIESIGIRTWFYSEYEYLLNDKNEWKRIKSFDEYKHAGRMKSKQGFYKVDTYSTRQFKDWFNGKEVEDASES
jgi:hypothetical protein